MPRSRMRRIICGEIVQLTPGDPDNVWRCMLLPEHRLDEHFDGRGHWWPRFDRPSLPTQDGVETPPADDLLF